MKVSLSTIGKFHTFALARELYARGTLQVIYTGYPWFKLKSESLPQDCVRTFPWLHVPSMRFPKGLPPSWKRNWDFADHILFDKYVANNLPPCDIFMALSSASSRSAAVAKSRGIKYICDRGSSHIRFQETILREEFFRQGIPFRGLDPRIVAIEEEEYSLADRITVPSSFSFDSFIKEGVPGEKLRRVPYGVDLNLFHPTKVPNPDILNVLFVGALSVRKGIKYLIDAFDQVECAQKHLTLVGAISAELNPLIDQLRPRSDISIKGVISHTELKHVFSESTVMVLPSLEEGLALVQAQALACGCPVIATTNTGAMDLFADGKEGYIVPIRDPEAIAERLQRFVDDRELRSTMSNNALSLVSSLGGWGDYGDAITKVLEELI
ncbi:MAG: glycosyltransferase family 4 protein [Janthinobacterium lividum]